METWRSMEKSIPFCFSKGFRSRLQRDHMFSKSAVFSMALHVLHGELYDGDAE